MEHGVDREVELLARVLRELAAGLLADHVLVRGHDLLQVRRVEVQVAEGATRLLGGVEHRVDYDFDDRRIDLTLAGGATVPIWWVGVEEWGGLVADAGLEVEARYGTFDREPLDETSSEAIYVVRRP